LASVRLRFGGTQKIRSATMPSINAFANRHRLAIRRARVGAVIAAATMMVVAGPADVRKATQTSIAALSAAAPPYRNVIGRLSGFRYQPFDDHAWSLHDQRVRAANSRLLEVAAEISATAARNPSPEELHTLGVSALLTGHWASAVADLETAVERQTAEPETTLAIEKTNDASLLSDLAAGYLALAERESDPTRILAAIECAQRAWSLSRSPEAAWNRAIAFETMHLNEEARRGWLDYLSIDGGSDWSAEASAHLSNVAPSRTTRPPHAVVACLSVSERVRQAERELFPQWARAITHHDASTAALVFEQIKAAGESAIVCNGDHSIAEAARAISALPPDKIEVLARAHLAYEDASKGYEADDFRGAEAKLRPAEEVFTKFDDPFRWRAVLLKGTCAYYENEFSSADAEASSVISRPEGEVGLPLLARAHWVRASSRGARGLIYEAIADYQAAAKAFTALNDTKGVAGVETMLASQFETAGEPAQAWTHRITALDLLPRRDPTGQTALLLLQMARVAMREGCSSAARLFLDAEIAAFRDHPQPTDLRIRALLMRAETEQHADEDAARRDRREAFALASRIPSQDIRFFTTTSADFVRARAAEQIDDASEIETAAQYARAHDHKIRLAELLVLTAKAYQRRGNSVAARRVIDEALRELDVQGTGIQTLKGRDAFFESRSAIYSGAITIALDQHDPEWAFRLSELNRTAAPVTLKAAQSALPSGTGIVKFFVLPDRLLIWLIRREQTFFFEQAVTSAQLGSAVRQFVARLSVAQDLVSDDELYTMVVAPWRNKAAGLDTVVFVTDGEIANVPFCTLHGQGHPLLEGFRITHAPGVGVFLANARSALAPSDKNAVIAAPDSGGSDLSDLPRTTAEGARVAELYRGAKLLSTHDATRSAFLSSLAEATIIHFAGHAVANERDPSLSALLLSGSDGSNAHVYAHEIASLPLHRVKLVVLAACSTASVPRGRKSGLASLAYAFASAGAHSVVGTLWPISDETGARVSINLHKYIQRGIAPAEALREIQLQSIHRVPPRDWAAYVVVGGLEGI
jgi:CHAT domain-containing protein